MALLTIAGKARLVHYAPAFPAQAVATTSFGGTAADRAERIFGWAAERIHAAYRVARWTIPVEAESVYAVIALL